MATNKKEGQVTLTQMLKALDKNVASGIEKRLQKLSKKKALEKPLDKNKADLIERQAAYSAVTKDVGKWESIVEKNRRASQLSFPLDHEQDFLPTSTDAVGQLKPINDLEKEVLEVMGTSSSALHDTQELSKAEEKYLKAISVEEAQERHRELQRMRVLLNSYSAKMRRQKAIKSKSYRRLLKHERIRKHVKKVESNKDALLDEIERLQRLRAIERASLKHKNTGKWAKHAKFRAKYDDSARKAMLEQIGLAEKNLERPAIEDSESESDSESDVVDDDDNDAISIDSNQSEAGGLKQGEGQKTNVISQTLEDSTQPSAQFKIPSDLINGSLLNAKLRRNSSGENNEEEENEDDEGSGVDDEEEDNQRRLISEAFANDDVVDEFRKAKDQIVDEEQPKDKDLYLPGWGDWAGPGIKENKRKRKKYIVKAKKIARKDDNLGNVIISEQADSTIKEMMIKKLPRGFKSEKHVKKMLEQPITATFVNQTQHRSSTRPRIKTKMGARIEPISARCLSGGGNKAKWA